MLGASTTVKTNKDASQAVSDGTRRAMLDASQHGFNVSQQHVPHGADSYLANQSAVEPTVLDDGSVVWGYNAEYARPVEEGSRPHWIPLRAVRNSLMKWARRVLGDESAAWPVRQKIAEEGTDAQPYVQPGVDAMRARLKATGVKAFIQDSL